MKPSRTRAVLTLFFLLTFLSIDAYAAAGIKLTSIDNTEHRLSEYVGHGKWVVLNIWGARCPPCREEMPELVRFHDEHKDDDAMVLGIAIDFPSYGYAKKNEVVNFADDYLIDFPLFLSDASVTERLGLGHLGGLPTTYIFNPEGKVVGIQVGGITKKIIEGFIRKMTPQTP